LIAGAKVAVSNRGVAIWFHHDDPHRISLQSNRGTFASTVGFLYRHGRAAQSRYPGLELAFARSLYGCARGALAIGCHDVRVDAITKARALGLRGHPGSPRRARICRMIGFVPAEYMVIGVRLTRTTLKRFRQRLLARPRP
jgi:hypothetical protein